MGKFKYTIITQDGNLTAKPLNSENILSSIQLIKANTICIDNCEKLFGADRGFEKNGALLETSSEQLYEAMNNPDAYLSIAVEDKDKNVLGFFCVQLDDLNGLAASIENLNYISGLESKATEWANKVSTGKMAFKGDIVIDATISIASVFYVLLYIAALELRAVGKTCCITEVFEITGYKYNKKHTSVKIYNRRSFLAQVCGGGACYVADGEITSLKREDGLEIEYYPKYLEYDFYKTYEISEKLLKGKNISVIKETC